MDLLEIGNGAMNEVEEQTQFSFWAALKSPLIVSTPLEKINQTSLDILLNKEIIEISQDDAGVAANFVPELSEEGSKQVWAGPLQSGKSRFVILAFNEAGTGQDITISLNKIPGYEAPRDQPYRIRDVWGKRCLSATSDTLTLKNVKSHQTKVLVFSL